MATILTRRLRLINLRFAFRVGEADSPVTLLAGVDFKKTSALIAALYAFLHVANGERLVVGAHVQGAAPFPAAVVVDSVDIIESGNQHTLEKRLAGVRGDVPPAFRGPALDVAVADGDAHPARGGVAQLEIGMSRRRREPDGRGRDKQAQRAARPRKLPCCGDRLANRAGERHCLRAINHG